MRDLDLDDGRHLRFAGLADLSSTEGGVALRRLPAWTRPQIVDPGLAGVVGMPSGARLELVTDATAIEVEVGLTLIALGEQPAIPAAFDLVVDGAVVDGARTVEGLVIRIDRRSGAFALEPGPAAATVRFDGLAAGEKRVEVWLPHAAAVVLRAVRVSDGASSSAPAADPALRRWVHHGSSISHCFEAERPTGVWPVVAARSVGVDLVNLGFAGQCVLDPFVARTIRDASADLVSLKVGINVVNGDAMRERVFVPALHGFLDTVRDGHPDVPLLVVSPILCPAHEDAPGPTVAAGDGGPIATVPRPAELAVGALSVGRIRTLLAEVVAARQAAGDQRLALLDGRELFGEADLDDLPDGLHPNAAGYLRMGERFASLAFGPGGPFAADRAAAARS